MTKQLPVARVAIQPLTKNLRKDSWIGAEVVLPGQRGPINISQLSHGDIEVLRQGLYDNSVLVIRGQQGLDPNEMPKLAAIWDDHMINIHSGGDKSVTAPDNILSRNNGTRVVRAPNTSIIGNGHFVDYEGHDELHLRHVVGSLVAHRSTIELKKTCRVMKNFMPILCQKKTSPRVKRDSIDGILMPPFTKHYLESPHSFTVSSSPTCQSRQSSS